MRFKMLGPLEVTSGHEPIVLGGIKQRATLGFLLLQPNQVVSTSQLLKALWSVEDAPTTARKILQNAIWGLRRALAAGDGSRPEATLKTQAPGYCLRVDPDRVDLHRFNQWVSEGRSRLAAGRPEEAAVLLRDALALWRGPALSDLVEAGVLWPELSTVQNARLGVQEDYFDAQLASGRHDAILPELEMMVDNEPLRERSCGQLMHALYRCGRQADALGVYSRLRTALVEDLGLEPSRELQALQQAILTHDPSLQLPESTAPVNLTRGAAGAGTPREQAPAEPAHVARAEPDPWERRRLAVLLVRAEMSPQLALDGTYDVAAAFDGTAALIRREIERFDGVFAMAMGGVSLGLFPAEAQGDGQGGHAESAVRAAVAIRDTVAVTPSPGVHGLMEPGGIDVRAAVTTGEALVRLTEDGDLPSSVNGALLHEGQSLLSRVPPGEVQVCARTHETTEGLFGYLRLAGADERWQVRGVTGEAGGSAGPADGYGTRHTRELDLLTGLLEHTRRWSEPHQVVVLGASDVARSRLLTAFRRRVQSDDADSPLVLHFDGNGSAEGGAYGLHRMVLAAYCEASGTDSPAVLREKLDDAVWDLARDPEQAQWLVSRLRPLLDPALRPVGRPSSGEWLDACRRFIEAAARRRPLVIVNDATHPTYEPLRAFLNTLSVSGETLPLLAVTGTRPEMPQPGRPCPSGTAVTTISLDRKSAPDTSLSRPAEPQLSLSRS